MSYRSGYRKILYDLYNQVDALLTRMEKEMDSMNADSPDTENFGILVESVRDIAYEAENALSLTIDRDADSSE
jgi:hypothetical protein